MYLFFSSYSHSNVVNCKKPQQFDWLQSLPRFFLQKKNADGKKEAALHTLLLLYCLNNSSFVQILYQKR